MRLIRSKFKISGTYFSIDVEHTHAAEQTTGVRAWLQRRGWWHDRGLTTFSRTSGLIAHIRRAIWIVETDINAVAMG
jgi:hypothetical protein